MAPPRAPTSVDLLVPTIAFDSVSTFDGRRLRRLLGLPSAEPPATAARSGGK
jgi:hypothetical protein